MLSDVTGAITGNMKSGLIISASDVRGEIVFYLRRRATTHREIAKFSAGKKMKQLYEGRAAALDEVANDIEGATIL